MDLNALIDTIDADRQSEHRVLTPCFLYGRCGTEVTGDEDDLTEMRRICDQKFMVKKKAQMVGLCGYFIYFIFKNTLQVAAY